MFADLRDLRIPHRDFNRLLQQYTAERFLYRLSISPEADRFTLKGATLFLAWGGVALRGTRDVDLVRSAYVGTDALRRILEAVCMEPCPDDCVVFSPESISISGVSRDPSTAGGPVRVKLAGTLHTARLSLQIDIGFGDVITPERQRLEFPTLLNHPRPQIWTYPRETVVAEKLHAMVRFGQRHSRIKDIWDIAALAAHFAFHGPTLRRAVDRTFRHRGFTPTPDLPAPFKASFYGDDSQSRWSSFHKGTTVLSSEPATLSDAAHMLRGFLEPVWRSAVQREPFDFSWAPGGPWVKPTEAVSGHVVDG